MRFIPEIIDQHAEEAAFLWLLRDQAASAPNYDLLSLASLDERIEAHLDGLRIAGDLGWNRCREELLAQGEAGEVFAATVLAFGEGRAEGGEMVLEVGLASTEAARGLISAIGWLPGVPAVKLAEKLLGQEEGNARRVGLAGLAVRREDPGLALDRALEDEFLPLRYRAIRSVGELGRVGLSRRLTPHLKSEDAECRFQAARALLLLGHGRMSVRILRQLVEDGGPRGEEAGILACGILPWAQSRPWLRALAKEERTQRLAVLGAGASGDPGRLPWLIEAMAEPKIARAAGEAFCRITGLDLAAERLTGDVPAGHSSGPIEDPADEENLGLDLDEDLPTPDPRAMLNWWRKKGKAWAGEKSPRGERLVYGAPAEPSRLRALLLAGNQRQRAVVALEWVLLEPGRPLFEVRAPILSQYVRLAGSGAGTAVESA